MSTTYLTEIKAEKNTIIVDEPVSLGGEGAGLSPMELLAASLGSCTAITLRMYAERKKWDLKDVRVEVTFQNDPNEKGSSFFCDIELIGDLSEEQREKLLEIGKKCPIHKTLLNPIEIESKLK